MLRFFSPPPTRPSRVVGRGWGETAPRRMLRLRKSPHPARKRAPPSPPLARARGGRDGSKRRAKRSLARLRDVALPHSSTKSDAVRFGALVKVAIAEAPV